MATKRYLAKYRLLKETYEGITVKGISDITWYRTVASLKQYLSLEIESIQAQSIVETYAQLKRKCPAFSFRTSDFSERWQAFKHFYDGEEVQYTGQQFLVALADYLKINLDDVPRSTRYYWFRQATLSYKALQSYQSKDLALVAFVAAKWAINKRSQPIKSATIEVLALVK
ncbi:MAG: hypothetical protein RM368_28985 [Nostoc sp. DedSLP03]|uniref:hypothetical protein n=1 Tax=Nostoc sp. DedSLP03 TaxID=3075400 RepID=UPI002AD257B4|nr:hypothetical protein [Nostoc sp. DedSLP03]MDZ7968941.1 hypothetical protein [Nostoc sp. DedSLP03]